MGLLSALPFSQLSGYGPGWGDYQRRQQQQPIQYRAAQPTMPPVPQLPSLTAPPNGQPMGPNPFAPAPVAPPPMAMPAMKEGPVQDPSAPQGMWGRINRGFGSLNENPLFNLGMSLLGNAQGSRWDQVGQDMRQFGLTQDERQRMQNEERRNKVADTREETAFGRQQQEWTQQDQQRARWEAAVQSEQDPQRQAQLMAIGPQGYGEYLQRQDEIAFQRERARVQDSQFQQSLAVDQARLASDRYNNSFAAAAGRNEAGYVAGMRDRLDGWRMVDNDLSRIEYWLQNRPDVFSSLLDGEPEEVLRRYTRRGDQQALTAAQELYGIGSNLSREELRGMTPVSNIDFLAAMRGNPTTASTPQFVQGWLQRARQDRQMMEQQYQAALRHGQQFGNLSAPDPATGLNFYQSTYDRYGGQDVAGADQPPVRGGRERWADYQRRTGGGQQAPQQGQNAPTTPNRIRPGTIENGWRFNGGDPADRRNWRYVGDRRQ